jgi:hypothetical protein
MGEGPTREPFMLEGKETYGVLDLFFPVRDTPGHKWTCQEFMHSWAAVQSPEIG